MRQSQAPAARQPSPAITVAPRCISARPARPPMCTIASADDRAEVCPIRDEASKRPNGPTRVWQGPFRCTTWADMDCLVDRSQRGFQFISSHDSSLVPRHANQRKWIQGQELFRQNSLERLFSACVYATLRCQNHVQVARPFHICPNNAW